MTSAREILDGEHANLRALVEVSAGPRHPLRRLEAARPRDPAVRAKLLMTRGGAGEALGLLEGVKNSASQYPVKTWLGECRLLLGDFPGALAALDGALQSSSAPAWARFFRACALLALGKTDEAGEDASEFESLRPGPAASALKGMVAAARGDWKASLAELRRAGRAAPSEAWPLALEARACRAAEDLPGARDALEKAVAIAPSAGLHAELARIYEQLGVLPQAVRHAGQAARLAPGPEHHALKAALHYSWREYAEADREYARALAFAPKDAGLHFDRSKSLLAWGKRAPALKAAERAARAAPDSIDLAAWLSQLLTLNGLWERARAAADTLPDPVQADFCRGYAALGRGRWAEAKAFFTASRDRGEGSARGRAAFYATVAELFALDLPGLPPARIHLLGLGVDPPYTATAESLRTIASCEVLFNNVPGAEMSELLMLFCRDYRPLAYHQLYDEGPLTDSMLAEVARGRRTAFVTRGNAIFYGPLGAEILRRCRRDGLSWNCAAAVSSAEFLSAKFGRAGGQSRAGLILDSSRLRPGVPAETEAALTVYVDVRAKRRRYAEACRELARRWGPKRECLVLDHHVHQEPLRRSVADLPELWDSLGTATIFFLPGAGTPPPERPKGNGELLLLGLGAWPQRHATLQTLLAAAEADEVYASGLTPDQEKMLSAFLPKGGLRRLRPGAGRKILDAAAAGRRIALITPGQPLAWSAEAEALARECSRRGLAWRALGAVSSGAAALSETGMTLGIDPLGVQNFSVEEAAKKFPRLNPDWPLALHCLRDQVPASLAALGRRLEKIYPREKGLDLWLPGDRPKPLRLQNWGRLPALPAGSILLYSPVRAARRRPVEPEVITRARHEPGRPAGPHPRRAPAGVSQAR